VTSTRVLTAGTAPESYPVRFQVGLIDGLDQEIRSALRDPPTSVFLITDRTVADLHGEAAVRSLGGLSCPMQQLSIPPGEETKTLATLERVLRAMARAGVDRGGLVVALGGGVITDLGGLAASLYRRGLPWVAVPTTLLCQVDAAIGGKTAVDLPEGKNLIGRFHPPRLVCADPSVLSTLPEREILGGLGEVLKYAILGDPGRFEERTSMDVAALKNDPARFQDLFADCAELKITLCNRDPEDHGDRQKLNLGHTIGHALEAASNFALSHGEAVAIGIVAETWMARRWKLAAPDFEAMIRAACVRIGLPVTARHAELPSIDRILEFLDSDKKRIGSPLRFALPIAPGEVRVIDCGDRELVRAAVETAVGR